MRCWSNMFCPKCGKDIDAGSQFCKYCGESIGNTCQSNYQGGAQPQYVIPLKSSGIAAVLALIIPGLGHIYAGNIGKGLLLLILEIILMCFYGLLFPLLIAIIIWVWQIYDAYKTTEEYNDALKSTGQKPW